MNRTRAFALSVIVLASTSVAPLSAIAATPLLPSATHAFFSNSGNIRFVVRNASSTPISLRCGDNTMTIAAGKSMNLDLPTGSRIVTAEATPTRPAGDLVAEVTPTLKNTTIVLH